LLVPTIRGYRTKAKESVYKLFLAINKMAVNCEEKVIIWRGLDIDGEINTY